MCDEGIDPTGFEKLLNIINSHKRNIQRFNRGFYITIERNLKNEVITYEEAEKLIIELERQ
jgi:hypothetical protein